MQRLGTNNVRHRRLAPNSELYHKISLLISTEVPSAPHSPANSPAVVVGGLKGGSGLHQELHAAGVAFSGGLVKWAIASVAPKKALPQNRAMTRSRR